MIFGPAALATRLAALAADRAPLDLAIALSGGADSAALLHAAAALAREPARGTPPIRSLRALHVDHGLQADAAVLRSAAATIAVACSVPLEVLAVRVAVEGESLEAAAREARYAALGGALAPGEWLVSAHQLEDQAETLLLQLLRGAGLRGLAAMPARAPLGAGCIVRPLLDVPRAALVEYATASGLAWHEDPMNADPRFDRSYLRAAVWPRLVARWPAAASTIARTASHAAEAQVLLDAQAEQDLAGVERGPALHVPGLLALPEPRRAAAVRYWLVARRGVRLPPARRLALVDREVLRAAEGRDPRIAWDDVELRRHDDALHLVRALPELPAHAALWPGVPLDLGGLGRLELENANANAPAPGSSDAGSHPGSDPRPHLGTRRAAEPGSALHEGPGDLISAARVRVPLSVRPRSGGERLRLTGQAHRRPLKDLLREARVPPWLRERVPVLWDAQRIVAVVLPDRAWIDADAAAAPGESGWRIAWYDAPGSGPP